MDVSGSNLRRALGNPGSPATLIFSHDGLTVVTPAGSTHIRGHAIVHSALGTRRAGLRAADADSIRRATDNAEGSVHVLANIWSVTVSGPNPEVTVGRW